ncbi:hypothetical protein [Oceanimonas marisflavi]|uniref:hypothetical protein n=1 Tax=Oceanimonas marisflavi TaxID=2059724 RepID=UPI001300188E|nr:hypothetical protein [Oceanimonas marisflavi]
MNIGYAMLYPYRGSVHNMIYISKLFEAEGHENFFLKCNASVPHCYNRLIKGTSKLLECSKCYLGGVDTFPVKNISSIDPKVRKEIDSDLFYEIVSSTSFSLHRIETDEDCLSSEVLYTQQKLKPLAEIVYENACKWIDENKLDLVFIFNGRLDMPRAVLKACESKGVDFVTFEASYPGVALEVNDDCRSLKTLHSIARKYKDLPLAEHQAAYAGDIAVKMLNKKNLVWRLYNENPEVAKWPINRNLKVLIVPSSNHEFKGVDAWTPEWKHPLDGVEKVIERLGASFEDCVIRAHPNWNESIGVSKDGYKSERVYESWAKEKGAYIIPSSSIYNTNDLMREADYIIVQYGTAGIEGALLGKKVIGLSPSWYSESDISIQIHSERDLDKLNGLDDFDSELVVRNAFRFLYVFHKRFPQYASNIQPLNIYENEYRVGASIEKILRAVSENKFDADDQSFGESTCHESTLVQRFMEGDVACFNLADEAGHESFKIERKFHYRWIDGFRRLFKGGDR